jgi:NAD(P)H-flavin reductase
MGSVRQHSAKEIAYMMFRIIQNDKIAARVYCMRLRGDGVSDNQPGQFIQLKLPEFFL